MDKVIHFEIPVEQFGRAQEFYGAAFGWQITKVPQFDYAIVRTSPVDEKHMPMEKGAINGGMLKRQGELKSPIITIGVGDIDASLDKVRQSGGAVVKEKFKVGEMGWSAYVKDTEGNVVGVWQPLNPPT